MTSETELLRTGERVEQLMAQLNATGDHRVSEAADELVRCLSGLYGAGLERIVEAVTEAEAAEVLRAMVADPLVSNLLILHDLHPLDAEARVQMALDRVRPYLASHGGDVEVLGLDDRGVLRLRLKGSCDGCGASEMTMKHAVEAAVLELAPEVVSLEVEGMTRQRFEADDLIPVQTLSPVQRLADWTSIPLSPVKEGHVVQLRVDGVPLLICRVEGNLCAYHGECAACAKPFRQERLGEDGNLECAHCGARFDARLAGRRVDAAGRALEPVPLLEVQGGVRLPLRAGG